MQKWEYARLILDSGSKGKSFTETYYQSVGVKESVVADERFKDLFDETVIRLGNAGWELVSAFPLTWSGSFSGFHLWFKRSLAE